MRSLARRPLKSRSPGGWSSTVGWPDLLVVPLTLILSVPPLVWFGHNWTVVGNDAARYLLAASELVTGRGLVGGVSHINHGPGFPALVGSLILLFGRDTAALVWAVRLISLVNPVLAYLLTRRLSGPISGLVAALLLTLFGFNVETTLNIDAALLTLYLSALLALLAAIRRSSSPLALLSGVLLGASILTKETAFANLPLALLAVLLLGWEPRGALWHYLGVLLVCLPWWIWAYSASGEVYLIDRLPPSLQVPVAIMAAVGLGLGTLAYATGMVARFLRDERRRRRTGWFVVITWTLSLCGLLLATAAPALTELSFSTLRPYLAELLAPATFVVPVGLLVCGFVVFRASGQDAGWSMFALALLFQVPVCLLVAVEGWAPRQFLVPQTLLFCALAALVVEAAEAALRGRGRRARLVGVVVAAPLAILLLTLSVGRAQALLSETPSGPYARDREAPQADAMVDWMAENIPEGRDILVTPALDKYLMFLDGGRHRWTFLRLDQEPCEPRPNIQIGCDLAKNDISRTPPDAVWVQTQPGCKAISLSMPNLLGQVRRTDSGYVMISGSFKYPGILGLPARLQESGAFEIVHAETGGPGADQGVVLLKSTGRAPEPVPTLMDADTVASLHRCEQARGPG